MSGGTGFDWSGTSADHWLDFEERYNIASRAKTERLFAAAAVAPGDRVLDIGCGSGETSRIAAAAATRGAVLGVDVSGPLLERARLRATEEGLANLRFTEADAQTYAFPPASYDLAVSRYGVMFFADPTAAFANVRRALRPGGRLAFLCWQSWRSSAYVQVPRAALAPYVTVPGRPDPDAPGPYSLADPARVRAVLTAAGWSAVELAPAQEPLLLGPDTTAATAFITGRTWVRELLAAADPETAARATDALADALAPHTTPDGVALGAPAWLVTARAA